MNYQASVDTPFSNLGLRFDGDALTGIDFIARGIRIKPETEIAVRACAQIGDYCEGRLQRQGFKLRLRADGTEFQQRVWRALQAIPSGETRTYGEIAAKLGTSARAVGNACRRNPIPLIIPCHRVIAAAGTGGYGGETHGEWIRIKRWLLHHENSEISASIRQRAQSPH
jgi:methylated-DNA-[protein]-cysteine S-methyltransferase